MSEYRFSARALRDLSAIVRRIQREHGRGRAEQFQNEVVRAAENLAAHPRMGHVRPDLTAKAIRFWTVHSHLIVYRPESVPLKVLRLLHGSRDPSDLRDRVGEPAVGPEHYAAVSLVPERSGSLALARFPSPE